MKHLLLINPTNIHDQLFMREAIEFFADCVHYKQANILVLPSQDGVEFNIDEFRIKIHQAFFPEISDEPILFQQRRPSNFTCLVSPAEAKALIQQAREQDCRTTLLTCNVSEQKQFPVELASQVLPCHTEADLKLILLNLRRRCGIPVTPARTPLAADRKIATQFTWEEAHTGLITPAHPESPNTLTRKRFESAGLVYIPPSPSPGPSYR